MKRLLCASGIGAIRYYRLGLIRVLEKLGWEVYVYDVERPQAPLFDIVKKFAPTHWLLGTYEIDRPTRKLLMGNPDYELILFGPNFGSRDRDIDYIADGVLRITDNEKQILDQLTKFNQNIKFVHSYYHKNQIKTTHDGYKENWGLTPLGVHMAADLTDYSIGEVKDSLTCDISFVGGFWPYKAINLDKYLIPLCNKPDLSVKIFGNGWPVANCLGVIDTTNMKHLFRSALICPAIYEPLSTKYGFDVSERPYKVLSAGGFCISQKVDSAINDVFTNGEILFIDSPKDLEDAVYHFKKYPDEREPYLRQSMDYLCRDGTYYHRVRDLAKVYGWKQEVATLDLIIKSLSTYGENVC